MAKAHANLGQFAPMPLFLGFGLLFALISLFAGQTFAVFFKAFALSMLVAIIGYGLILAGHKASVGAIVGLLIVSSIMFLGLQAAPQYFPLQTVPMNVLPGTNINVQILNPTVTIPDAILALLIAFALGLLFKLSKVNEHRSVIAVVLSTAVTFFAATAIIGGLIFGTWGEWLILLTPFTGIRVLGLFVAIGYFFLAYLIWIESRLAFYIYFAVQFIAIALALWLQQWLSTPFSVAIILALYLSRRKFHYKADVSLPSSVPSLL